MTKRKKLSPELSGCVTCMKRLFVWLHKPENTGAMASYTEFMIGSGGTVSQLMLQLVEEQNQKRWPWNLMDDSYVVRTVAHKVSNWLKLELAIDLQIANQLRSFRSE